MTQPIFTLITVILIILNLKLLTKKQKYFLYSWFLSPLWLTSFHFRVNTKLYILLQIPLYIIISIILVKLISKYSNKIKILILSSFILVFVKSNSDGLVFYRANAAGPTIFQSGTYLAHQLELIDFTYQHAAGEDFSISTYTNPLRMSITWSYLYDWYGQSMYGYKPYFVGHSQIGLVTQDLLPEKPKPLPIHYSIIEPNVGAEPRYYQDYLSIQDRFNTYAESTHNFGSIKMEVRASTDSTQLNDNHD